MTDQRRMRRVGNSWVVPVSREVRQHLKVSAPAQLYWHLAGPREAVLTPHPQRVGGKPAGIGLAKDLDAARAEIERLKQKLAARPVRAFNQGASMGAAHVLRQSIPIEGDLAAIMERLDRIESALAQMPWARRRRQPRAPARPVETVAAAVLTEPATHSGEPPARPRRSSPVLLDGIARDVLEGIAERRREVLEEQHTSRSDL